MKRKITLLLLAASSVFTMKSQVVLNEGFTSPFNIPANGWATFNSSVPTGTATGWRQGYGLFAALSGNTFDYFSADLFSCNSTGGGISNWLFTPTLNLVNGAVVQFATRTALAIDQNSNYITSENPFPDRLQVRLSATGSTGAITGTASVGSYTTLLMDINPNLNTNTTTAVTSGTMVNGYPQVWTIYTVQISGLTAPAPNARIAFRYFVDMASGGGTSTTYTNSYYIGLDNVKVTMPCGASVTSFTTCAGQSVVLNAQNGLPATTYTWSGPSGTLATTQSVSVIAPNSGVTVYTLSMGSGTYVCPNTVTATVTQGSALSVQLLSSVSNTSALCSGQVVNLQAVSAGTSNAWSVNGNTTSVNASLVTATLNSAGTTTFSVLSSINSCFGTASIVFSVVPTPTLSYVATPSMVCPGGTVSFNTSGASLYGYYFDATEALSLAAPVSTNNPFAVPLTSTISAGGYMIFVVGVASNGCYDVIAEHFTVVPNPTVSISSSTNNICRGNTVILSAGGADTYSWTANNNYTTSVTTSTLAFPVGTVQGVRTITVVGTSTAGCVSSPAVFTQTVAGCLGIENIDGNNQASIYPNPFSAELTLSGLQGSHIEVYNTLGQIVVKTSIKNSTETVNMGELTKGIYIIKAFNSDGELTKTVKVMKN